MRALPVVTPETLERLQRRLDRERKARREAEEIAERATRELYDNVQDLRDVNEELERFAYIASHDLQEPLRMVISYCQLLQRRYQGALDQDADEFIGYAVDGAMRMQQLIEDLLSYSRVGSKGRPLELTDCDDVFQRSLRSLQSAIDDSGAVITCEDLPLVNADARQMTQLFQNLLGNAIKFRGAEAPRIHVGIRRAGQEWLFSVRDNGIGIDPQYRDRVFDVFERIHGRGEYPGTGIGLSICKRIVERHGGRIWVESPEGSGAEFRFTLPVVEGMS